MSANVSETKVIPISLPDAQKLLAKIWAVSSADQLVANADTKLATERKDIDLQKITLMDYDQDFKISAVLGYGMLIAAIKAKQYSVLPNQYLELAAHHLQQRINFLKEYERDNAETIKERKEQIKKLKQKKKKTFAESNELERLEREDNELANLESCYDLTTQKGGFWHGIFGCFSGLITGFTRFLFYTAIAFIVSETLNYILNKELFLSYPTSLGSFLPTSLDLVNPFTIALAIGAIVWTLSIIKGGINGTKYGAGRAWEEGMSDLWSRQTFKPWPNSFCWDHEVFVKAQAMPDVLTGKNLLQPEAEQERIRKLLEKAKAIHDSKHTSQPEAATTKEDKEGKNSGPALTPSNTASQQAKSNKIIQQYSLLPEKDSFDGVDYNPVDPLHHR